MNKKTTGKIRYMYFQHPVTQKRIYRYRHVTLDSQGHPGVTNFNGRFDRLSDAEIMRVEWSSD